LASYVVRVSTLQAGFGSVSAGQIIEFNIAQYT